MRRNFSGPNRSIAQTSSCCQRRRSRSTECEPPAVEVISKGTGPGVHRPDEPPFLAYGAVSASRSPGMPTAKFGFCEAECIAR